MAYIAMVNPPGPRAEDAPPGLAPGLYPGEVAVTLDSGDNVAVVVESRRLENGDGMMFVARARAIQPDGQSRVDPYGQPIEAEFGHHADPLQVEKLGVDAIARELGLAALGEPPTLQTLGNGDQMPLIPWSDQLRISASVRKAMSMASKSGPNTKTVLGL